MARSKPVVPQQSAIDADIAANMRALGITVVPKAKTALVYEALVLLARTKKRAARIGEVAEETRLTKSQTANAIGKLVMSGKAFKVGGEKSGFYVPRVV